MSAAAVLLSVAAAQVAEPLTRTSADLLFSLSATPGSSPQHPAQVSLAGPDGVLLYGLYQPDLPEHLLLLDGGDLLTVEGPAVALYDAEGARRWSRLVDPGVTLAAPFSWRREGGAVLLATEGADAWLQIRLSDGHAAQIQRRYRRPSVDALLLAADHAPPAQAAELARRALAADTQHVGAWLRLIRALQAERRHSPAVTSADLALQIPAPDPAHPDWAAYRQLYVRKADSARILYGTVEADAILRAGLAHAPGDPVLRDALAAAMIAGNRADEARALFPLDGADEDALAEAGDFFAAQGALGAAEVYYQRLAAVAADPVMMGRLAELYRERQDLAAAAAVRVAQLGRWVGDEDWRDAMVAELDLLEAAQGRLTAASSLR